MKKNAYSRILDGFEKLGTVLLIAGVVAGVAWYLSRQTPPVNTALCREYYRGAHSARDTAMIDETVVGTRPGWTCGMLRRTGATAPRPPR